jgi:hypothetical protein
MFYTGVRDVPGQTALYQRTGLAVSTDLFDWQRLDTPVFDCGQAPWSFCDSTDINSAFRDPHVMPDPARPGGWLMFTTAVAAADPSGMVVGVARSDGDPARWSDVKPLWITHPLHTYSQQAESPLMVSRGDSLYYLFWTTNFSQPLVLATSPDPLADPAGWTPRGALGPMLGYEAGGWIASEYLRDGLVEYLAYVDGERIEIRRLRWGSDWRFTLGQPDAFHVVRMSWSDSVAAPGDTVALSIISTWGVGRKVIYDVFAVAADGREVPLDSTAVGLPRSIPVSSDSTAVRWAVGPPPLLPETGERVGRIRLRTRDLTAATPVLRWDGGPPDVTGGEGENESDEGRVTRAAQGDRSPSITGPPVVPPVDPVLPPEPEPADPTIRPLRGAPAGVAFEVELRRPAPVRVEVFDLGGRRVRVIAEGEWPAGARRMEWDGRDDAGARLPRGLYFARVRDAGAAASLRLFLR